MSRRLRAVAACVLLTAGTACATTADMQSAEARSEIDRAVGRCAVSVIGGALLGAIVGNNTGRGNAGRGAVIGASAGGAVCAVIMVAAREKAALLESQRAAVAGGLDNRQEIRAKDGSTIVMNNRITDAPSLQVSVGETTETRTCKYASSTVEVAEGSTQFGAQRFCQTAGGAWELA